VRGRRSTYRKENARTSGAVRCAEAGRPRRLIRALARYAPYPIVHGAAAALSKRRQIAAIRVGAEALADEVLSLRALLRICVARNRDLLAFVAQLLSARFEAFVLELAAPIPRCACFELIGCFALKPLALCIAAHGPPAWRTTQSMR
jgi:hypothetical protein